MTTPSTNPSVPPRATDTQPGSLYHRERDRPRSRRSGGPGSALPSPRKSVRRAAAEAFLPTLRTLVLVLAGMGILLYVALKVNQKTWDSKLRGVRERGETADRPVPASAGRESGLLQDVPGLPGTLKESGLEAETVRTAVDLATEAQALEDRGLLQEAEAKYHASLDIWPFQADTWARLGRLHLRQSAYGKAQQCFEKSLEQAGDDPEILNDLGVALISQKRFDRAQSVLQKAVLSNPEYDAPYFNLALCHLGAGDLRTARTVMERFMAFHAEDPRGLRQLAYLDAAEGRYQRAHDRLTQALQKQPEWPLLHLDLAATQALLGSNDAALASLRTAAGLSSPQDVIDVFRQPAFASLRETAEGKALLEELGKQQTTESPGEPITDPSAPIPSDGPDA